MPCYLYKFHITIENHLGIFVLVGQAMGMDNVNGFEMSALEKRVGSIIKPRGRGMAFKMLKHVSKELERFTPSASLALCQLLKGVNIYGSTILASRAYVQSCADGEHVLGFREHPEELKAQWTTIFGMAPQTHDRLVSDVLHVDFGVHEGALFAPLGRFDELGMVPDGVIFDLNGIQAELLILSTYLHTGKKPVWSYDGYAACEIVAAVEGGRSPWMVLPCLGARSFCSTQDDEIWFGITIEHLRGALVELERNGMAYPPAVEQAPLSPPLKDHLITRLMTLPD
jgi:uncharacterized protein (DUF169 family)